MKRPRNDRPDNTTAALIAVGATALVSGVAIAFRDREISDLKEEKSACLGIAVEKNLELIAKQNTIDALEARQLEDDATKAELRCRIAELKARAERAEAGEHFQRGKAALLRRVGFQLSAKVRRLEREIRELRRDGDAGPMSG